jgi:hypothetical protein
MYLLLFTNKVQLIGVLSNTAAVTFLKKYTHSLELIALTIILLGKNILLAVLGLIVKVG